MWKLFSVSVEIESERKFWIWQKQLKIQLRKCYSVRAKGRFRNELRTLKHFKKNAQKSADFRPFLDRFISLTVYFHFKGLYPSKWATFDPLALIKNGHQEIQFLPDNFSDIKDDAACPILVLILMMILS